MKPFIAVLVLVALAFADDRPKLSEEMRNIIRKCAEENNIPFEQVQPYMTGKITIERPNCYAKCVADALGVFDIENGFDARKAYMKKLNREPTEDDELYKKIKTCTETIKKEDDACAWAHKTTVCFIKSNTT